MSDQLNEAETEREVIDITRAVAMAEAPWFRPIHFAPEKTIHRDARGPSAESYGVYNPLPARIYLGLFGGAPREGSFPVPRESALIIPIRIPDTLEIGIDAGELGENSGTIYVMRFKTVQPFFLGGL